MEGPTRVLIADDHPIFREGLVRTIERDRTFQVVGQCGDGAEALRLVHDLHPDVAVLDISMPVMDGLEVARRAHKEGILTELVVLTMYKDARMFSAAFDLGVRGYIVKDGVAAELMACLNAVRAGEYYASPSMSHLLQEQSGRVAHRPDSLTLRERLTPAELAVLKLVAENRTSKEIGEKLFVSVRTVENHRARMSQKLGLKGYHALLQFALENKHLL